MAGIDEKISKMAALGRQFHLGGFYNYRTDVILKDALRCWQLADMDSFKTVNNELKIKVKCSDQDSANKWEVMGLDEHLQMSTVAGIIDKYKGASNYLNDRQNPAQATRTLVFRVKSKRENLNLESLIDENVSSISGRDLGGATHVVVGLTYGAEAYCVLTQDLANENDQDAREEAEENLSRIISKMESSLEDNQDLAEFKDQFDREEKLQVNRLKCRLYADLQTQAVRECGVFDAYKHCLKLIEQVKATKSKAIQISVRLCPLKDVIGSGDALEWCDVDGLAPRCCSVWAELEQVSARADALKKGSRTSMRQFGSALSKYLELLKTSLKKSVIKARQSSDDADDEVERVVEIAESHPLFKPSQLQRWLRYKQSEVDIAEKVSKSAGIPFVANKAQLEKELGDSFDKKYSLVLNVPSLDERTNGILEAMADYVENYTKLVPDDSADDDEEDDEDDERTPWQMVERKRKQVMAKIREFADYVAKNKHLENQAQFFITSENGGKKFGCSYSVYENENCLKGNKLPVPPTNLRVRLTASTIPAKNMSSVSVEWDYEDLGYPCQFLVEFRSKGSSDSWKQQKTGEPRSIVKIQLESTMEIRVAADSCIGRSEFSEVVDTESAIDEGDDVDRESVVSAVSSHPTGVRNQQQRLAQPFSRPDSVERNNNESTRSIISVSAPITKSVKAKMLQPPTDIELDFVTQSTAEFSWSEPSADGGEKIGSYRVRYWPDGQDASLAEELDVDNETGCRLENLQPETMYWIEVMAVSSDGRQKSEPSEPFNLTTSDDRIRFAETILKRCKKAGNRNGMDLYNVPLTKSSSSGAAVDRLVFGKTGNKKAGQAHGRMQHKTILVMGATGSGKTTLINGMINYIFDVQWDDPFRFQLIQEQQVGRSQVDSQTSRITAYEIHHSEGFRVPYSLTIVDTPGYGDTKGLDRDQEITEMVRQFFEDKGGIQELDVVGFVAQASLPRLTPTQIYIFDSVLSIFGNDIKENINFLLTFADSQVPPVLSAISQAGLPCPIDNETGDPLHHKFNNSGFFCSNREASGSSSTVERFNRFFWRMGMENFQRFFNVLATMTTKSLSLTKQVLEERKRLEATVDGLQPLIKVGLAKMEEMRKTKQMISNSQAQIEANENVEFEVEVTVPVKMDIPAGQYLTNCNKCYVTCHNPCAIPNDDGKVDCAAMDFSKPAAIRTCIVCPEKCIWNLHSNQPYMWEYVNQKQMTSSDAIKQKYESEMKRKLTAQDLIKVLQNDLDDNEKEVLDRVNTVTGCIRRLDEIALRPNPFSTPQYIDLIIDAEQQEKRVGFKERIESLKKLRQLAVITSKIQNQEPLLSLDRRADADDNELETEYEDQQTSYYDDDENYDGASLVSAATDRRKFENAFARK